MAAAPSAETRFTVLVLAGDRGPQDPVSQAAGVVHKCLAPVAGRTMLERVVAALVASPQVGPIAVSLNDPAVVAALPALAPLIDSGRLRSEEPTSELQSLMRISYAVFCLKKKKTTNTP